MNTNFFSRISEKYYVLILLGLWIAAVVGFGLLSFEPYGLDEGAARALLLNWSVVDQIASPIVIFGMPDFRALFFIPLGLYWPGSVVAAKIFTAIISFIAIWLCYRWNRQTQSEETALLGSGLLLIAPINVLQIDAMGAGPYLLLMFGLALYIDKKYRTLDHAISGWYFVQLLAIATTVTLHPAGLAYPLALAWHWFQNPVQTRRRNQVWIGIAIAVGVVLVMRNGWAAMPWFGNPLPVLGTAVFGLDPLDLTARSAEFGVAPLVLIVVLALLDRKFLLADFIGSMLILGVVFGLLAADMDWALLAITFLLYRGVAWLIKANQAVRVYNFFGQRGVVLIALFIAALAFMQIDKAHAVHVASGVLSPQDELIHALAAEANSAGETFRVASQWPGRTMIATKHAALPLPPAADSGATLRKITKGVTHLMFAHNDPRNAELARNIAELGGNVETVALQAGGVIIRFRDSAAPTAPAPAATHPAEGAKP